jgi:lysophospholipase L1-like esterase
MKRHHWETKSVLHGGLRSGRFGLAGVTAGSFGGAGSTFIFDRPVHRLHLFYRGGPRAGGVQVYLNEEKVVAQILDAKSESWSDRVWSPDFAREISWARIRAAGGGRTELYGVVFERAGPGVVLDTLGIVGIRARRWRKADKDHMAAQVQARGVDLIVLNFGGNERVDRDLSVEKHGAEIQEALALFRAGVPEAACLLVGPLAHGHKGRARLDPRLETVGQAQRRVADQLGCAYMDTVALMGGTEAISRFRAQGWMGRDLAHLNGKGHRELGARMGRWLLSRYDLWKRASDREDQDVGPPSLAPPRSQGSVPSP